MTVLAGLDAFLHEHRYCGEIEAKVELVAPTGFGRQTCSPLSRSKGSQ